MVKSITYSISSLVMLFTFETLAVAQINKEEIAIRYFHTLNYNILYWEREMEGYYEKINFLPVGIVYGNSDTTYSIVRSTLSGVRERYSSSYNKTLFNFLPPKNQINNEISIFSSNVPNIYYQQTKPDLLSKNFDDLDKIQLNVLDLEYKLSEYSELEWESSQYEPGVILGSATVIFGALAYRGFSNARKGNNEGWNRALGIISVSSIAISIPIEISELLKRNKRRKRMKVLELEFQSY